MVLRSIGIALAAFALLSAAAMAQNTPPAPSAEAETTVPEEEGDSVMLLRPGDRVVLTLDNKLRIAAIKPGRTLGAEPAAAPVPGAVVFTLTKGATGTTLQGENYTGKTIIYAAALLNGPVDPANLRSTSICPISPGISGFESWPERVDGVVIFKFFEASLANGCFDATELMKTPK
jgi:hypothetical protein